MFTHLEAKLKYSKNSWVLATDTVPALYVISKKFSQWVSATFHELPDLRFSVPAVKRSIFQNAELTT